MTSIEINQNNSQSFIYQVNTSSGPQRLHYTACQQA